MPGYDIISKGSYGYPQEDNAVPAVNYIFIDEGGAKYLLLEFRNTRRGTLTGLDLEITQLDGKGNSLGVKAVKYGDLNAKPKKQFVLTHKIPVDGKCSDFKVKVLSAMYGSYAYSVKNGMGQVDYLPPSNEKFDVGKAIDKMRWENRAVAVRTVKRRVLIGILSALLIALVLVFTFLQLEKFKNEQVTFIYGGVKYAFEGGDNSDSSNISAVGYSGRITDAVIPEKIEKHYVTEIASGAFVNNESLRTLTVEGAIPIGRQAFEGCVNLESISIERVTSLGGYAFANCGKLSSLTANNLGLVGIYAFSNCTSLESVSITNDKKTLQLGGFAFNGCTGLQTAEIAQETAYPEDNTVFRGCNNITELKLKNFECISGNTVNSLVSVFGTGNDYGLSMKLQTLSIDRLDFISDGFAANTPLQSFTVSRLESPEIGDSAFSNCKSLTELNLPEKVVTVGEYAFFNTAVSSFDASSLTYAGNYSFYGTQLQSFDGTKLSYLGDYAFAESALESFAITGNTVCNYLGEGAFGSCKNLVTFEIPVNVTAIGKSTFEGCAALQGVTFAGGRVATIGEKAFYGCGKMPEFNFPASVTSLGDYAFGDCSSFSAVTVPSTVTSIGLGAFSGCTSLDNVTLSFIGGTAAENSFLGYIFGADNHYNASTKIPASLKTVKLTGGDAIGDTAFYGCSGVEKIIIPEEVTHIGVSAFEGCSSLQSVNITENLKTISTNAFNGCASFTSFEVPSSVISIGGGAFGGCTGLESLTVPFIGANDNPQYSYLGYIFGANGYADSAKCVPSSLKNVKVTDIQTVSANAFAYCESVQNIVLPNVQYIGESAFGGCKSLKEINLPETLQYIGNTAFSRCSSLQKLTIPQSVNYIGNDVFQGCFRLYEIWNLSGLVVTAPNAIKIYTSLAAEMEKTEVNGYVFASSASDGVNYLIDYPAGETNLKLPSPFGYTVAGYLFYQDANITSVEIPSAVTALGDYAFYQCAALASVTFTGTPQLNEIGSYAFNGCEALQYFAIPNGVKYIRENTFFGCLSLNSVTVPSSVIYIGDRAFYGCVSLREANLPEGLTAIDYAAFAGCASLQSVVLPQTLGTIAEEAFYGCVKLRLIYNYSPLGVTVGSLNYGRVAANALVIAKNAADAEYVVEKGVSFLRYLEDWTVVWAEDGTTQITLEAFRYNNYDVNSFTVQPRAFADNSQITSVKIGGAVSSLGEYAFYNVSSLKRVTFENAALEEIKPYTFAACRALQSVIISGDVARIGDYAFAECGALASLTLPASLKELGEASFGNCASLTAVTLPAELNKIGDYAFSNCSSLTGLTVPASVKAIGAYAFTNCTKLVTLKIEEGVSEIGRYAFASTAVTSVEIPSTVASLGAYSFNYCSMLTSLKFAEGVTAVEEYAFYYCANLREVSFASTVSYIGEYAFSYCFSLESLNLPASLKEVSGYSFVYDTRLKGISIPESVTKIGEYAFANASSLEKITFPEGLREIGYGAFMNCGLLSEVTVSSTVVRISDAAFSNCERLYVVYNFGTLQIKERSDSYGSVALNAVKVFTSPEERASFAAEGEFEFVYLDNEWYLFKYHGADSIIYLPEKFSYNGATVAQYTVREYAFERAYADGVVVTSGVKTIQRNAFAKSMFDVYFIGDANGWIQIGAGALPSVKCYYHVNCVHGEGQWTYDRSGRVSTVIDFYSFRLEVTKQPTCIEDGTQEATCVNCGYVRTYTLEKTGIHEYEWVTTLEPTCVNQGISVGTCIHCGETTTSVIERTGVHVYEWTTTAEPDCTHEGVETGTCIHCGTKTERPLDKLPHNYVDGECTQCGDKSAGNGN